MILPLDRRVRAPEVGDFPLVLARQAVPVKFRPLRPQPRVWLRVLPAAAAPAPRPVLLWEAYASLLLAAVAIGLLLASLIASIGRCL